MIALVRALNLRRSRNPISVSNDKIEIASRPPPPPPPELALVAIT
jgi:hypothetical protein